MTIDSSQSPDVLLSDDRDARRARARATLGLVGDGRIPTLRALRRQGRISYSTVLSAGCLLAAAAAPTSALLILAPEISNALGVSTGAGSGLLALQVASIAGAATVYAWAVQGRHRRALACLSAGIAGIALVSMAAIPSSLTILLLVFSLLGAAAAAIHVMGPTLVADGADPAARVRMLSAYYAFAGAGALLGFGCVGLLGGVYRLSWRGVLLGIGLASVALVALALRLRDPGYGKFDIEDPTEGLKREARAGDVALGFWETCRRAAIIPSGRWLYAGVALIGSVVVPFGTTASTFFDRRYNVAWAPRAWILAACAAGTMVGPLVYARRGERHFRMAPSQMLKGAGRLFVAASVLLGIAGFMPGAAPATALLCIGVAGIAAVLPLITAAILAIVPPTIRPHAQALATISFTLGGLWGWVQASGILDQFGPTGAMVTLGVLGFFGGRVLSKGMGHVDRDVDRRVDEHIESEAIREIRSAGRHLPLLACRDIRFSYGQLQVLFDVDFTVDEGEMVALLGVNGAGKSTLLKVISGIASPWGGSVRFQGEQITHLDAERRLRLGIMQIPGGRAVFGSMTVVENLRSYVYTFGRKRAAIEAAIDDCFTVFPRLAERRNSLAVTLSGGEQQMLGLCRALMLKPRLLLIDELSLGLAPLVVSRLLEIVRRINDDGTAVVLVEQSVNVALSLVQHAYFMEKGAMRFDGRSEDLLERNDLLRAVFLHGAAGARA